VSHYIVQTAAACMPSSCKYGPYRRVAVIEVEDGVQRVAMISPRARGAVRVVKTWERLYAGSTDRCAYSVALATASALAADLNRDSLVARTPVLGCACGEERLGDGPCHGCGQHLGLAAADLRVAS
jgi:hypothetical protein